MKFYKIMKDSEIVSLEARPMASTDSNMIELSEEEYVSLSLEFSKKAEAEAQAAEQAQEDYIAELEAENAALLYQVLTGEELTDV